MNQPLEWRALEYERTERRRDWYAAVCIIAGSLAVTAFLARNVLFAAIIVIGTLALLLYAKREPRVVAYRIEERGVRIGRSLYPYAELESFAVSEEEENAPKLILKARSFATPYLVVPIAEIEPALVREELAAMLPEADIDEPLSERIMRGLGF